MSFGAREICFFWMNSVRLVLIRHIFLSLDIGGMATDGARYEPQPMKVASGDPGSRVPCAVPRDTGGGRNPAPAEAIQNHMNSYGFRSSCSKTIYILLDFEHDA